MVRLSAALALLAWASAAHAEEGLRGYGFGAPASAADIAAIDIDVMPDGRGLPAGSGSVADGRALFAERCAVCHGDGLEGVPEAGGARLVGGRGTLATDKPVKTVESYWPYATTLFDYVRRAMPFTDPGSLTDNEVYALSAFILSRAGIVGGDAVLDAASLARIRMPNRDGFFPDDRPDIRRR